MEMLLGFSIAFAIGLTAVGGGVLTAPMLILFLGLPAPEAVGTSLVFVAAMKTLAVPVYLWRKQVSWSVLGFLLAGGIPGVLAGSILLQKAAASGLRNHVLAVVGLTVAVSASLSLFRLVWQRERVMAGERRGLLSVLSAGIGLEVGFSSAGAGALGTIALLQFTRLTPATVVGTDLLFGFVLSAIGGGFHLASGSFHAAILTKLIAGGAAGAMLGAYLAPVFPSRILRAVISLWLIFVGSQLCWRGLA